ncbi:MAG: hypothetical protein AAB035_00050, partial [Nitrospirota bacterium]
TTTSALTAFFTLCYDTKTLRTTITNRITFRTHHVIPKKIERLFHPYFHAAFILSPDWHSKREIKGQPICPEKRTLRDIG